MQRSSFRLFDCVGRGSLDFRNFCRALALSCRGSREERLRFLFDLYSGPSQPKHYGTGADGGARDATSASGATSASVSEVSPERIAVHARFVAHLSCHLTRLLLASPRIASCFLERCLGACSLWHFSQPSVLFLDHDHDHHLLRETG